MSSSLSVEQQHALQTAKDLVNAGQTAMAEGQAATPSATKKQYSKPQRLWTDWCLQTRRFPDGTVVHEDKLCLFLEEIVLKE